MGGGGLRDDLSVCVRRKREHRTNYCTVVSELFIAKKSGNSFFLFTLHKPSTLHVLREMACMQTTLFYCFTRHSDTYKTDHENSNIVLRVFFFLPPPGGERPCGLTLGEFSKPIDDLDREIIF